MDLRAELAAIDVPTLVLHGDRDASPPLDLGRACAAGIRGARLEVIAGGPHGTFVTHAARVTAALRARPPTRAYPRSVSATPG